MTRYRVTVRAPDMELRGFVDGLEALNDLSQAVAPRAVFASIADDNYTPFTTTPQEHHI